MGFWGLLFHGLVLEMLKKILKNFFMGLEACYYKTFFFFLNFLLGLGNPISHYSRVNGKRIIKSYFFLGIVSRQDFPVFFFAHNAGILQPIDSRLVKEILANIGVIRDVHEMRRCLNRLVQSEIFTKNYWPPKLNKRFCPRLKTKCSHMV